MTHNTQNYKKFKSQKTKKNPNLPKSTQIQHKYKPKNTKKPELHLKSKPKLQIKQLPLLKGSLERITLAAPLKPPCGNCELEKKYSIPS
jgi:hypothetical protein